MGYFALVNYDLLLPVYLHSISFFATEQIHRHQRVYYTQMAQTVTHEVDYVQFSLMSPEEIRNIGEVEVTHSSMYQASLPKDNGMNDVRMGTTDKRYRCGTCRNNLIDCPGHTGYINLNAPVLHIGYVDTICKILRCICYWCSALKVDRDDPKWQAPKFNRHKRKKKWLSALSAQCKGKQRCPICDCCQPQINKVGSLIKAEFKCKKEDFSSDEMYQAAQTPLTIDRIRLMLKHISDEDVEFLGFNSQVTRPEWMVLTCLLVPPPAIRPSVIVCDGSRARGQDDITVKLQEIQKVNLNIGKYVKEGKPVEKLQEDLQSHIAQMIDKDNHSSLKAKKKAGGRTSEIRSFKMRITGKKGRVRWNLMGKRVNFSSRSVITPDASIDLQELGVPEFVALKLTFPEIVNSLNLERMQRRIMVGAGKLEGASTVISPDKTMVKLIMLKEDMRKKLASCLRVGSIVERYLQNGDVVVFNRQPSLHKESMMGHFVRIMPGLTFRLNVSCTSPYNADFDGDEMNMHVPQSYEAVAEIKHILNVQQQIVSPQANAPVIGAIQDTCVGSFRMSDKDTFISPGKFMNYSMEVRYADEPRLPVPAIVWPRPLFTGKQMLSYCLPKVCMQKQVRGVDTFDPMDSEERCVVVRHGELLCGKLCKASVGKKAGGIPHLCCNDLSNLRASNFLSDLQRLVRVWLRETGFSIGLKDCICDETTHEQVGRMILDTYVNKIHDGMSEADTFNELQKVLSKTGKIVVDRLDRKNGFLQCTQSGSKGSIINICQIMGCIGQTAVLGGRPQGRMSCYRPTENHPVSRGFCPNSYVLGLSPQEFSYSAWGGREGMINTAVKTALTGYISRKLIKFMESLMIAYDRTVRSSNNQIMQFSYGGDGFDARWLEKVKVPQLTWKDADVHPKALALRNGVRDIKLTWEKQFSASLYLPVNVPRLFTIAEGNVFSLPRAELPYQHAQIDLLMQSIERHCGKEQSLHVRAHVALELYHRPPMPQDQLNFILQEINARIQRALVEYGSGVGPIAASSIGEPTTQVSCDPG